MRPPQVKNYTSVRLDRVAHVALRANRSPCSVSISTRTSTIRRRLRSTVARLF